MRGRGVGRVYARDPPEHVSLVEDGLETYQIDDTFLRPWGLRLLGPRSPNQALRMINSLPHTNVKPFLFYQDIHMLE